MALKADFASGGQLLGPALCLQLLPHSAPLRWLAGEPAGCRLHGPALSGCCTTHPGCLQGKLEQAIGTYQRAIAAQPQFPEAYNNLGNALREAGRPEDAIAAYTTCIQLQVGWRPTCRGSQRGHACAP